jgi:hypothetical protein
MADVVDYVRRMDMPNGLFQGMTVETVEGSVTDPWNALNRTKGANAAAIKAYGKYLKAKSELVAEATKTGYTEQPARRVPAITSATASLAHGPVQLQTNALSLVPSATPQGAPARPPVAKPTSSMGAVLFTLAEWLDIPTPFFTQSFSLLWTLLKWGLVLAVIGICRHPRTFAKLIPKMIDAVLGNICDMCANLLLGSFMSVPSSSSESTPMAAQPVSEDTHGMGFLYLGLGYAGALLLQSVQQALAATAVA